MAKIYEHGYVFYLFLLIFGYRTVTYQQYIREQSVLFNGAYLFPGTNINANQMDIADIDETLNVYSSGSGSRCVGSECLEEICLYSSRYIILENLGPCSRTKKETIAALEMSDPISYFLLFEEVYYTDFAITMASLVFWIVWAIKDAYCKGPRNYLLWLLHILNCLINTLLILVNILFCHTNNIKMHAEQYLVEGTCLAICTYIVGVGVRRLRQK